MSVKEHYLILQALREHSPATPIEIRTAIQQATQGKVDFTTARLFDNLSQLAQSGYIQHNQTQHTYAITQKGQNLILVHHIKKEES